MDEEKKTETETVGEVFGIPFDQFKRHSKVLYGVPITVTEAIDADTVAIVQNGKVVATITNLANKESPAR